MIPLSVSVGGILLLVYACAVFLWWGSDGGGDGYIFCNGFMIIFFVAIVFIVSLLIIGDHNKYTGDNIDIPLSVSLGGSLLLVAAMVALFACTNTEAEDCCFCTLISTIIIIICIVWVVNLIVIDVEGTSTLSPYDYD